MASNRWLRRAAPALLLGLLLAGCETEGPRSTLEVVGPVAQAQRDLFMWTYWLSWPVVLLVVGVIAYVLWKFRVREGDETIPHQTHGNAVLEIGWTILPVLIVIAVAVPTVRTIFTTENRVEATPDDLIVNVTGYQWWWRFEYPQYGVVTANELRVPQGTRLILDLNSADVLHSFWVPKLAGKRDLIPNQDNQLWIDIPEDAPLGAYLGHCAELCLGAHAYMRFRVIVEDRDSFGAWVEAFQDPVSQPQQLADATEQVQRGYALFAQKGCTNCHTVDEYRTGLTVGDPDFPDLTNFGLRTTIAAAVLPNTQENLERWLRDPQAVKPTNYMPTLWPLPDQVSEERNQEIQEEVAAIAAYLLSLGIDSNAQQPDDIVIIGGANGDR